MPNPVDDQEQKGGGEREQSACRSASPGYPAKPEPLRVSAASAAGIPSREICGCGHCTPEITHASDCAVHSEPTLPAGACDCGADASNEPGRAAFARWSSLPPDLQTTIWAGMSDDVRDFWIRQEDDEAVAAILAASDEEILATTTPERIQTLRAEVEVAAREADAPDRIKALLTQVETLTQERDETQAAADRLEAACNDTFDALWHANKDRDALRARALTAEAERDALRDKLVPFVEYAKAAQHNRWGQGEIGGVIGPDGIRYAIRDADLDALLHTEKREGSDER